MKLLATTAVALALAGTAAPASAWTGRGGHWHEGPTYISPGAIGPQVVIPPYAAAPVYGLPAYYGAPVMPGLNIGVTPHGKFYFNLGL
jgi:hypothetical protein